MLIYYIIAIQKKAIRFVAIVGKFKKEIIDILKLNIAENTPIMIGSINVTHMKNRHPYEYDKYFCDLEAILDSPDYVGINPKDKSVMYIKEYKVNSEYIRVGVKVAQNSQYFVRTLHLLSSCNAERYIEKGTLIKVDK